LPVDTAHIATPEPPKPSLARPPRLIWPALEHTLKCSHLFNILDSSNSIGVTERTAFILRIRQLAIGVAKSYVEGPGGARPAEASSPGREA